MPARQRVPGRRRLDSGRERDRRQCGASAMNLGFDRVPVPNLDFVANKAFHAPSRDAPFAASKTAGLRAGFSVRVGYFRNMANTRSGAPDQAQRAPDQELSARREKFAAAVTLGLREIAQKAGGVRALSDLTGIPVRTLQNFTSERGVQPSPADLALICAATSTPIQALLGIGDGVDLAPDVARSHSSVPIRVAEVRASPGHGSYVADDHDPPYFMDIPRSILEAVGLKPPQARIMEAVGASMQPTINDGDLVLVDISPERRARINDGRVYVFSVADQVYVKRLRRTAAGLMALSDNAELFPEEKLPADQPMTIFGQVLWAGRKL
jgi:hypothetical protein